MIKCCKDCISPKRHVGCHATCKDYQKECEENEKKKKWEKENKVCVVKSFDFDYNSYFRGDGKRHKRYKKIERGI